MSPEMFQKAKRLRKEGKLLREIGEELGYSYSSISVALGTRSVAKMRNCSVCGIPFNAVFTGSRSPRKTCSLEHEQWSKRKVHYKNGPCQNCGKVIPPSKGNHNQPKRFCTPKCAYEWGTGRTADERKKASDKFDMQVAIAHELEVQRMKKIREENLAKYGTAS